MTPKTLEGIEEELLPLVRGMTHCQNTVYECLECKDWAEKLMEVYHTRIKYLLESVVPEKLAQADDESDSDWFYGLGFNHAIKETRVNIKRIL